VIAQLKRLTRGNAAIEQRASPRRKVRMPAKVGIGGAAVDCTVTDISASGAQLHAQSVLRLPDEVQVLILSEGLLIHARRVWARFPACGLKFTSVEAIQRSAHPQAGVLKEAWATWRLEQIGSAPQVV
jgi:hypothetical protein